MELFLRKTKVPSLDLDFYSLGDHVSKLLDKEESRNAKARIPERDTPDQADKPEPRRAKESFFD